MKTSLALSLEKLKFIMKQFPYLRKISLVGVGEPLLNPELFEIIRWAKKERILIGFATNGMLLTKKNIENINCIQNDAENLSFRDNTFNGAIVAFGIRNVEDIKKALSEMNRVVKKGGKVVVLEFSLPENKVFKSIYYLYFQKILPFIGCVVSRKKGAYSYLPSSVMAFPERREFVRLMDGAGLADIGFHDLTFGIVTVYAGVKL